MLPEAYGALDVQFARALHKVDAGLKLGGPVFEGVNSDILVWPDGEGRSSWLGRFLAYLRAKGQMEDLAFFPFEHYPFDPCKLSWDTLYREPEEITGIMKVWREDGLPETVPMMVTETNISWNINEAFVTMYGGLWEADYIGSFLTGGGKATYFFHYLPLPLERGCDGSWGTFSMQTTDKEYRVGSKTAQFFAAQLISREWVQPGAGEHKVYAAAGDVRDEAGHDLVTAYVVERPDGKWSVMALNKDPEKEHRVRIVFHDGARASESGFTGAVRRVTFGPAQYVWHADGAAGFAKPDGPAAVEETRVTPETEYLLPAASISVITGAVGR